MATGLNIPSGVTVRPTQGDEIGQPLLPTFLCTACDLHGSNVANEALTIRDSIFALTTTTSSLSLSHVRQVTNELVRQAGDQAAQVDLIEDVFNFMTGGTEIMNEILTETWGMLIDDGLWKAKFATKNDACQHLDSGVLQPNMG